MAETKPPSPWLPVPAGTRAGQCRSRNCGRAIYWIEVRGRPHPVNCDVLGGRRPSSKTHDPLQQGLFADPALAEQTFDGRGKSHFEDCPDADHFRRGIHD